MVRRGGCAFVEEVREIFVWGRRPPSSCKRVVQSRKRYGERLATYELQVSCLDTFIVIWII